MVDRAVLVGTFDLLHVGHLDLIRQARATATELHVGVLSDRALLALADISATAPTSDRARIAQHLSGVDSVFVTGPETNWDLPTHDLLFADEALFSHLPGDTLPWPHARLLRAGRRSVSPAIMTAAAGLRGQSSVA